MAQNQAQHPVTRNLADKIANFFDQPCLRCVQALRDPLRRFADEPAHRIPGVAEPAALDQFASDNSLNDWRGSSRWSTVREVYRLELNFTGDRPFGSLLVMSRGSRDPGRLIIRVGDGPLGFVILAAIHRPADIKLQRNRRGLFLLLVFGLFLWGLLSHD